MSSRKRKRSGPIRFGNRATYQEAIEWVANNDNDSSLDFDEIGGSITISLIADIFRVSGLVVTRDVLLLRKERIELLTGRNFKKGCTNENS